MAEQYQGIVFPNRAEDLRQTLFENYHVYLDYWTKLSTHLKTAYEAMAIRGSTSGIVVYGPQGSGKTLFADRFKRGFERTRAAGSAVTADDRNLWHVIVGGKSLDLDLIRTATDRAELMHIEDDTAWSKNLRAWVQQTPGKPHIVIADNAERSYFVQGLMELSDRDFLTVGRSDAANQMAAERFVALCRTAIKPALFLIFANSEAFARNFVADVEKQHKGLLSHVELPLPSNTDKETAVRTNINRLNPISYWYCLDRAGPASKVEVYNAIKGQATFPDCFLSVDKAIAESSRMGRDANTCILSLVVFIDADTLPPSKSAGFGAMINKLSFETEHVRVERFSSGWAQPLIADTRRAKMLESEWSLRIVTLSNRVADALLSAAHDDEVRELLDLALEAHSVGTQHQTLAGHAAALQAAAEALPEVLDRSRIERFWAKGQLRATDYEGALRRLYADYNKSSKGFLAYRPDLVIEPYGVCSVLNAADGSADGINDAIKRRAHAVEFTASKEYDANKIRAYLEQKLMNYVHVVETQ